MVVFIALFGLRQLKIYIKVMESNYSLGNMKIIILSF